LRKANHLAVLEIDDQGSGIDPRRIGQIFERYVSIRPPQSEQRVSSSESDVAPSRTVAPHAGLGLWIVRRNVETLGGRVQARNRDEGGFSIQVVLPVDRSLGSGDSGNGLVPADDPMLPPSLQAPL
jgi:two-component system, OmpR family, sensor histidine kinase ChvG